MDHLAKFVIYKAVIALNEDLVTTKSQKELTLGRSLPEDSAIATVDNEHVQGALPHSDTYTNLRFPIQSETLLNCYGAGKDSVVGKIVAFNGHVATDGAYFPGATLEQRTLRSCRDNVPPLPQLGACADYRLLHESYYFLWPPFLRKVEFRVVDKITYKGQTLMRLTLKKSDFEPGSPFICSNGLQNMTAFTEFVSWLSLPHFLFSSGDECHIFKMNPDTEKHTSTIEIEPISGMVWNRRLQYQMNIGVREDYFKINRSKPLNIGYLEAPIPVFWVDSSERINQAGIEDFKERVMSMLGTSCGGLIGLSVLACPVLVAGLLVAIITKRNLDVTPVEHIALY